MNEHTGDNLRRIMAEQGLSLGQVVARTGLDRRTIGAILDGSNRPHSRTIHRLAAGLGVSPDEFFVNPGQLLYRRFDAETNPVVRDVVAAHPELFAGWSRMDFEELHSRFGEGGALTAEGTQDVARRMNRNRQVHERLALLLESHQADVISDIVEVMYRQVVPSTSRRSREPQMDTDGHR
ncbi:MAG TPA: helix-turn-helix transcriptional regulator [Thermoguttaceae bacterium]|nr:helix-turn-helix transcriptional regulator [Thermoguttaceae bacterium]